MRRPNWSRIKTQIHETKFKIWSGARDLNPGPHGPELCELLSKNVGNDRFQFETSEV